MHRNSFFCIHKVVSSAYFTLSCMLLSTFFQNHLISPTTTLYCSLDSSSLLPPAADNFTSLIHIHCFVLFRYFTLLNNPLCDYSISMSFQLGLFHNFSSKSLHFGRSIRIPSTLTKLNAFKKVFSNTRIVVLYFRVLISTFIGIQFKKKSMFKNTVNLDIQEKFMALTT